MSVIDQSVSIDKQYEQIAGRVAAVWATTYVGFKLYLQIFSAILGGSIWLKIQMFQNDKVSKALSAEMGKFVTLSNALVILLTVVCLIIVFDNVGTWWGWRKKLAAVTVKSAVEDKLQGRFWAFALEVILAIAMIAVSYIFIANNPFEM